MALAPPIRWVQPSTDSAAAPETARPGDWSELSAIERASGELELTATSRAFALGLATRQTTRTIVAPSRRGSSLEAPHGLVRGIARVLDGGRRDGPDLAPAPPDRAKRQPAATAGFSTATDTPPPAGEHELDADAAFVDAEAASVDAEAAAPAQETASGEVDTPETRPRVVQAVSRSDSPATREASALTRATTVIPERAPAGRISRAPLPSEPPGAHAGDTESSSLAASATGDVPAPGAAPSAAPLPDFVPRRVHGRPSAAPPAVEPEGQPDPRPAPVAAAETVGATPAAAGEPAGAAETSVPTETASPVATARWVAARSLTAADEPETGVSPATAPAGLRPTTRDSAPTPTPAARAHEPEVAPSPALPATPVQASVVARHGDDAAAALLEEQVSIERDDPALAAPSPAATVQPARAESDADRGESTAPEKRLRDGAPGPAVSRASAVQRRFVADARATAPIAPGEAAAPAAEPARNALSDSSTEASATTAPAPVVDTGTPARETGASTEAPPTTGPSPRQEAAAERTGAEAIVEREERVSDERIESRAA